MLRLPGSQQVFRSLKAGLNSSGGSRHANTEQDIQDEETGKWFYLVVDPSGIRPRDDASYSKDTKSRGGVERPRYKEGEVVEVNRRRRSGWTRWVGLSSGDGWLFDVSPKDKKVRMVEVEVASGNWQYVTGETKAPILSAPSQRMASQSSSFAANSLGGGFLRPGEIANCTQRIRPVLMKGSFLLLSDGRGWTVDFLEGRQLLQRCGTLDADGPTQANGIDQPISGIESSDFASPSRRGSGGGPGGYGGGSGGYGGSRRIGSGNWTAQQTVARANTVPELGQAEDGDWDYMVVDPKGFSLRGQPTYDKGQKTAARLLEGDIAKVVQRRTSEGTSFLRVTHPFQGWAFDRQPGALSTVRLMEVQQEEGSWHYTVVAEKGVALRSRCSMSQDCKVGAGPQKGALVLITKRVRTGDSTFLYVDEAEKGWIFDQKQGKMLAQGPVNIQKAPPDCSCEVIAQESFFVSCAVGCGMRDSPGLAYQASASLDDPDGRRCAPWGSTVQGVALDAHWVRIGESYLPRIINGATVLKAAGANGVHLATSPTHQRWAASKMFLLHQSRVVVSQLVQAEGERWARVSAPGGGMEGWLPERLLAGVPPNEPPPPVLAGPTPTRSFNASEVAAAWNAPNPLKY